MAHAMSLTLSNLIGCFNFSSCLGDFKFLRKDPMTATAFHAGNKTYYGAKEKSPLQHRSRACGTIQEYGIWGIGLLALLEYNKVLPAGRLWW